MTTGKPPLLERRLTFRMVIVQIVTLLLFFGVGVFPFTVMPVIEELGNTRPLDPRATTNFAESLVRKDDGTIAIQPTAALAAMLAEHPGIWFFARDTKGQSASLGDVPPFFAPIEDHLDGIEVVEVRARTDSRLSVLVRPAPSPVGEVQIMTGGGPTVGLANLVQAVSVSLALATVVILSLASIIVIPRLIRRELSGIKVAAARAEQIDIDTPGTRLPTTDVPAEVASLVTAVNDALTRLDDAYARRERFLADSAHELRTPIAIIQTRIETAAPFPEKSALLMDVARLASLAGQLLDLQRLDAEPDIFESLDLVDMAETVVGDLAPLAITGGYDLSLDAPDAPVHVLADAGSLSRALTNLIQNAIAYGGNAGPIRVAVTADGRLTVTDSGPGVAASERQRIFEPFYRVRPSSRGAGLGLSLVADIVRRHKGTISVDSAPDGGARFTIRLPVASA